VTCFRRFEMVCFKRGARVWSRMRAILPDQFIWRGRSAG
jgi:hypothetical protein